MGLGFWPRNFYVVSQNFVEFPGVLSENSKIKEKNLKIPEVEFSDKYILRLTCLNFFGNSSMNSWVSSKKLSCYFMWKLQHDHCNWAFPENIPNRWEGWWRGISWVYIEKTECGHSRVQLKLYLKKSWHSQGWSRKCWFLALWHNFMEFFQWQTSTYS